MPKTDLTFDPDGYAPVAHRIQQFYHRHPTGRIITHLVRRTNAEVVFRAEVFRMYEDPEPAATGWAVEREGDGEINTVACLENTETSAIGRALANLGLAASIDRPRRAAIDRTDGGRARAARVGERPPRATAVDLQGRADRATDVLAMLRRAARLGLSTRKSVVLREHLVTPGVDAALVARIDRRLRDWLERRLERVEWPERR
jgi:hypothetical protein